MTRRYQIQDIAAQDLFGVIFHAQDTATGRPVALRRFFPFGADGGGLFEEERAAYNLAVERLAGLQHPGLRAVLAGGSDPVDGMPFLVTEWIDGQSLEQMLERETFAPAAAIAVLMRVLELSEAHAQVLGGDAVWVETAPSLILEDQGESNRGLTFCISPLTWLGEESCQRSLRPLAQLADNLLGWSGKWVADQAGNGLGGWIKWVRANADTLTLFQVREGLARLTGEAHAEPVSAIMPAVSYEVALQAPSSKRQWLIIAALSMAVVMLGWWMIQNPRTSTQRETDASPPATPQNAESKRVAQVNARATALAKDRPQWSAPAASPPSADSQRVADVNARAATLAEARAQPAAPGRIFQIQDSQLLLNEKNREVTVEGVLKNLRWSQSDNTLYLEFSDDSSREDVRGYCLPRNADETLSEQALKPLIGKRIQMSGVVRIMSYFKIQWPEVLLKDRAAIKEVK